jgi:hypothetical protein
MRKSRLSSVMRHWMNSREGLAVLTYTEAVFLNFYGYRNLFQGIDSASLCSLAGRYENPIPT